jgi:glycosyltransferase involved in cell wall biosynthesis
MNNLHISLTEFRNASRVLKIIRSLLASGIVKEAFVAAYSPGQTEDEIVEPGIMVKRFHLKTKKISKTFFVQMFKYIEFWYTIYKFYKDKRIGLINIHSVTLLPLGVFLKRKYNALLVYDAHELETETSNLLGLKKIIWKIIEKLFIGYVDLVVVVGDLIADWYQDAYRIRRPHVLLNTPNFRKTQKKDLFRQIFNIAEDKLIFLYQGALMQNRGIELIIEAFKEYKPLKSVLVFMGYGILEPMINDASQQCDNIYYLPAVSPDILLDYTSSADIGFAITQPASLSYYYSLPNKLFEYIMAGLPVVISDMKEMAKIVRENNIGIVVDDLTAKGIASAVFALEHKNYSEFIRNIERLKMKYNWELQEDALISAYQSLLTEKTHNLPS